MLIHQLNEQECVDILARNHLARLACARDEQPYIVPIHYSYDAERDCIFGFSTIGQKVEWMRENPKVCVEVEEIAGKYRWATVIVTGLYDEIHQSPAESATRQRAEDLFRARREWWLPAAARLPGQERHEVVVYRIRITTMTGRRTERARR